MGNPEAPAEPSDKPILILIQQIKDGSVNAATLSQEQRRQCVAVLRLEGYAYPVLAQILGVSEKTIQRDMGEIRARNIAAPPSPALVLQIVGDFLTKMETHHAHLMRLARDKTASVGERAQAELFAARVLTDTIGRLQALGYLPLRPQQVVGNVVHYLSSEGGESSLENTEQTILEIKTVAKDTGTLTPELTTHIQALQRRLEQEKLSQDAQRLLEQQRYEPKETPDVG